MILVFWSLKSWQPLKMIVCRYWCLFQSLSNNLEELGGLLLMTSILLLSFSHFYNVLAVFGVMRWAFQTQSDTIHVLMTNVLFNIRFRPLDGHPLSLEGPGFDSHWFSSSEAILLGFFAMRGYLWASCESILTLKDILCYDLLSLQIIQQSDLFWQSFIMNFYTLPKSLCKND